MTDNNVPETAPLAELIPGFPALSKTDKPADLHLLRYAVRLLAAQHPEFHEHLRGAGIDPTKGIDFNQILALLNGPLGALLIGLISQLATAHPTPAPTPPVVPPTTPPVTPPSAPVVPAPPTGTRIIASFLSHWLGWEDFSMRQGEKHAFHHLVKSGLGDLKGKGWRGHIDYTPRDQNGVPFYNSDLPRFPELFAIEPGLVTQDATGKWTCGEGNNRIGHIIIRDGQEFGPMGDMDPGGSWEGSGMGLSSETDEAADTPVVVSDYDLPLSVQFTISERAIYHAPDGRIVPIPALPAVIFKPWDVPGQEA
jgi:hypothetical protein